MNFSLASKTIKPNSAHVGFFTGLTKLSLSHTNKSFDVLFTNNYNIRNLLKNEKRVPDLKEANFK